MATPVNPNSVQCNSVNSRGLQCKRRCAPGFTVCNLHGGGTPSAKAGAERALATLRLPFIEALNAIVDKFLGDPCDKCGSPSGTQSVKAQAVLVRAAQVVLDRTGMGPHSVLEVKQSDGTLNLKHWTDEERAELAVHLTAIKELKARVARRIQPGSVEGSSMPPLAPQPPGTM